MTTMHDPNRTISIPVSAAWHASIGIVLALISLTAFWVHFTLPADHEYKATGTDIGNLAGCAALVYWIWCDLQRGRIERLSLREALAAAAQEAAEREQRLLAALESASGEICQNRSAIKELSEAVDVNTGAIEALQDCYMDEGEAPDPPDPGSRDFDLAQREGPAPSRSGVLRLSSDGAGDPSSVVTLVTVGVPH